ncbi:copper homeostasis protein CutC [Georgenia subflava]|uniref:PF03932 family protein CutC n=1 Tax=Georgenia subflava TaxID=1622177 RepID=A0A6N7EIB6_9MICO|nr:copper homeostasis protein CutC [Georgenia subflava]
MEIAVQDVDGVRVAAAGGADRVELCQALAVGGLTPSVGLVEVATTVGPDVHVLVRPRPGGFVYTATEVSVMVRDVEALVDAGASGVVVGALTLDDGAPALDRHALKALVRAAEGRPVTVHRCVDVLLGAPHRLEPADLVEQLLALGISRVLTSGGAPRALEGTPVLGALVGAAAGRLEIMAGGGVHPEHLAALAEAGVDAIHLSARAAATDAGPAGPGGGPDSYDRTDPDLVAAARAAIDAGAG